MLLPPLSCYRMPHFAPCLVTAEAPCSLTLSQAAPPHLPRFLPLLQPGATEPPPSIFLPCATRCPLRGYLTSDYFDPRHRLGPLLTPFQLSELLDRSASTADRREPPLMTEHHRRHHTLPPEPHRRRHTRRWAPKALGQILSLVLCSHFLIFIFLFKFLEN
jgi:hypothetical protein